MTDTRCYQVPASAVCSEQVIKHSRFICHVGCCENRYDVDQVLSKLAAEHPKANHICWAYIAGPPSSSERNSSDDGEPRGTAGRPMLTVLDHSGFGEIWAAVIRYFGGIKLGKGGLIRAYTSSVQQALARLETEERQPMLQIQLHLDYNLLPLCEPLLVEHGGKIINRTFTDRILLDFLLPESAREPLRKKIIEISKGTVHFESNE